ncbi:hypothetical protein RMATCC62417_12544 [Rhizopus microsporus]|nr:hypothetical protein RMATCC62417_12544 [Rhizopus microsporus]
MKSDKRRAAAKPVSYTNYSTDEEDELNDYDDAKFKESFTDEEENNNSELESLSEEELDEEDDDEEDEDEDEEDEQPIPAKSSRNNKRKKPVIEDDSEEGFSDGEEVIKNRPMTKRQRAKLNHEEPEDYLQLPMDTGKKKLLTEEEEQLRKSEVARRRKNQSIQRAEKDKADTINRLLKKQASKTKRVIEDSEETAQKRQSDPKSIKYVQNTNGSQLSIPQAYSLEDIFGELKKPTSSTPIKCQVEGCSNDRKYTAKKSGKFVCSFEHYKLMETQ